MRWIEGVVVVIAMLIPLFAIKTTDFTTFAYWVLLTTLYLGYIAFRRWEVE
jgi:hypothetical protein